MQSWPKRRIVSTLSILSVSVGACGPDFPSYSPAQRDASSATTNQDAGTQGGPGNQTPDPALTTSVLVGAAGADIASLDRSAELTIAPNSVADEQMVSMEIVPSERLPTAPPLPVAGTSVKLLPHGLLFGTPTTVRLKYDESVPTDQLMVLRLNDETDPLWEPVSGARFEGGIASFETNTFSVYTLAKGDPSCWPAAGTAACGGTCSPTQYCSSAEASARTCVNLADNLCANPTFTLITDAAYGGDVEAGRVLASGLTALCPGKTVTEVSATATTALNACTGEPMLPGGNTIVIAGGPESTRLLRNLGATQAPIVYEHIDGNVTWTRRSDSVLLAQYAASAQSTTHDWFTVQVFPDTIRGSLIVNAFGLTAETTGAAAWYFKNTVVTELLKSPANRLLTTYRVIEWTDNAPTGPGAEDIWRPVADDKPTVTTPPVTVDAGVADAGVDAGRDSGVADAGVDAAVDAGVDAGRDAGVVDAGGPPVVVPPAPKPIETPWFTGKTGSITTLNAPVIAGYEFIPSVNGTITALGTNSDAGTYKINLYANGNLYVTTVTTTGTNGGTFFWGNLATPVAVTAGTTYTVAVVLPKPSGLFASAAIGNAYTNVPAFPRAYGNVRINRSVYVNSITNSDKVTSKPATTSTNMAGAVDIKFQPN